MSEQDFKLKFPIGSKWRTRGGEIATVTEHQKVGMPIRCNGFGFHESDGTSCLGVDHKFTLVERLDAPSTREIRVDTIKGALMDIHKSLNIGDLIRCISINGGGHYTPGKIYTVFEYNSYRCGKAFKSDTDSLIALDIPGSVFEFVSPRAEKAAVTAEPTNATCEHCGASWHLQISSLYCPACKKHTRAQANEAFDYTLPQRTLPSLTGSPMVWPEVKEARCNLAKDLATTSGDFDARLATGSIVSFYRDTALKMANMGNGNACLTYLSNEQRKEIHSELAAIKRHVEKMEGKINA